MKKILYGVREAAQVLNVSVPTVTRWCRVGILRAHSVGDGKYHYWAIPAEALEGFVPPKAGRPRKNVK